MEHKFETLEEWKAYLKRDKTQEFKAWKQKAGIETVSTRQVVHVEAREGELR